MNIVNVRKIYQKISKHENNANLFGKLELTRNDRIIPLDVWHASISQLDLLPFKNLVGIINLFVECLNQHRKFIGELKGDQFPLGEVTKDAE